MKKITFLALALLVSAVAQADVTGDRRFNMCQKIGNIARQNVKAKTNSNYKPEQIVGRGFPPNVREIGFWAVDFAKHTDMDEYDAELYVRRKCLSYINEAMYGDAIARPFKREDIK
ncbi:hypothetical protein QN372_00220 [Undibacterium sp. RTI2.1]|uniref:hypothetical protein n=1 Tax=unclassified Undibacterium TaxID=2630295 RepID=UPI002AB39E04|nr:MULTISPECIES: hypothetical protein [unclassified Undibacterium]MDY7537566.1 hypothetical protein [Undibacterium sp. 5I1]MEB0029163.1 hypothetical protein [Undibacterium sp. RTI2.1]MEB0115471.1 hypothetical protein [Undibacterium sp. RTI2.2]MEB0231951.1 hypothetical protein [Undibacterium sp. 10I3]MEB0256302.1 hypothetical protein [Undibacterium sp. 5I1]